MAGIQKQAIFALGLGLIALLAGFNLFYGYHPSDDGFVLGFVWRVWNGEIPHRDFISIRPPLTLLLHQIWMLFPEHLQFPAARAGFYLWMGVIWWTGAVRIIPLLFEKRPRWIGTSLSIFTVFWLYSIHNFPPTPWHTVDGLVLSTLSIFLLVEAVLRAEKGLSGWLGILCISSTLAGLAPFTKQSFSPAPVLHLILVGMAFPIWKKSGKSGLIWLAEVIGLLLGPAVIALYVGTHGAWASYQRQVAAASDLERFLSLAVRPYFHFNRWKIIAFIAGLASAIGLHRAKTHFIRFVLLLLPAMLVVYRTTRGFDGAFYHTSTDLFFYFMVWTTTLLTLRTKENGWVSIEWILGLGSLGVAWMVSISMGYNFPILGFAGIGLFSISQYARINALPELPPRWVKNLAFGLAAAMLGLILALNTSFPFRDRPRVELTHDLARLFPKFGPRLMTNPETFDQIRTAKLLAEKYSSVLPNRPLIVFPEFSLFYFLAGRRSSFPIDWWISMDYLTYETELTSILQERLPIVLFQLESSTSPKCTDSVYPGQPVTTWLLAHSKVLERSGIYCVLDVQPK